MFYRTFKTALISLVEIWAIVQGYQVISGSPDMVRLFSEWKIETKGMGYFGSLLLVCAVLMFFRQTYFAGNLLLILAIAWIIYMQMVVKEFKTAAIQTSFLLLSFLLICLK